MHSKDHVLVGHTCRIAGRAGVAATVDGEGLPELQGTCGWQQGVERGERTWDRGPLPTPTLVSLLQATPPASLPNCKQHRKTWV